MPEFRQDPFSGRWVIIAENRAGRPDEFRQAAARRIVAPCPFCAGREHETPPASATYAAAGLPAGDADWQVRVIPNKYPAVQYEAADPVPVGPLHPNRAACGGHEVIVESPRHVVTMAALDDPQAEAVFAAYQDRLVHWQRDSRLAYGLVFKNARSEGGASLEHAHSQLIAMPVVPAVVAQEAAVAEQSQQAGCGCPFCALLERELAAERRLVAITGQLAAFCPYASRFPFETWIMPRQHAGRFEETSPALRNELARLVRQLIGRLETVLTDPPYNFWIHTAPWNSPNAQSYHWHLELVTRTTRMAGFELGTGYFINPVSPEEAARRLRLASTQDGVL